MRASGPLPALRVGRQPYGLLPTTSLNFWKPKAGQEQDYARDVALQDLLVKLRELWRRNLVQVPRLGRGDNPDQDFADVLSMEALSSTYAARHLMGEAYLQNLWSAFTTDTANPWWSKQQELTLAVVRALGFDWHPNLSKATYSGWHKQIAGPMTQLEIANETAPLDPDYIQMLLAAPDVETVRLESFGDPKPRGLLYLVLRHALLLEYWTAAANLTLRDLPMGLGWSLNRDQEIQKLSTMIPVPQFQNVWELLNAPLTGVTDQPLGTFLHELKSTPDPKVAPHVATLFEFRESLAHLQTLSAANSKSFCRDVDLFAPTGRVITSLPPSVWPRCAPEQVGASGRLWLGESESRSRTHTRYASGWQKQRILSAGQQSRFHSGATRHKPRRWLSAQRSSDMLIRRSRI